MKKVQNKAKIGINEIASILNKKIINSRLSQKNILRVNEKNIKMMINLFNKTLCDILSRKDLGSIKLRGFLQINKSWQEERYNTDPRNPSQKIHSNARYIIRIKAGSALKNAVK